jgi:hypothetical protein
MARSRDGSSAQPIVWETFRTVNRSAVWPVSLAEFLHVGSHVHCHNRGQHITSLQAEKKESNIRLYFLQGEIIFSSYYKIKNAFKILI